MPGLKRECSSCQKVMRSDNLKIHEKVCKGKKDLLPNYMNKEVSGHQPKNPVASRKVSNFINDIVNKDTTASPQPIALPPKDPLMKTLKKKPAFQSKNLSDESDDDDESLMVVDEGTNS